MPPFSVAGAGSGCPTGTVSVDSGPGMSAGGFGAGACTGAGVVPSSSELLQRHVPITPLLSPHGEPPWVAASCPVPAAVPSPYGESQSVAASYPVPVAAARPPARGAGVPQGVAHVGPGNASIQACEAALAAARARLEFTRQLVAARHSGLEPLEGAVDWSRARLVRDRGPASYVAPRGGKAEVAPPPYQRAVAPAGAQAGWPQVQRPWQQMGVPVAPRAWIPVAHMAPAANRAAVPPIDVVPLSPHLFQPALSPWGVGGGAYTAMHAASPPQRGVPGNLARHHASLLDMLRQWSAMGTNTHLSQAALQLLRRDRLVPRAPGAASGMFPATAAAPNGHLLRCRLPRWRRQRTGFGGSAGHMLQVCP